MTKNINKTTEQENDIPLLIAQGKKMGIPEILDEHFNSHGNWQGNSFGWTSMVWLAHILSEGDHRLNPVEMWVENQKHILEISIGDSVRVLGWSDDRLGKVLDKLGDDEKWVAFETELNRQTIRVYNLKPQRVRVDSTTASGYWMVTNNGLFQYGHSKVHSPDLPQFKVMITALDPLGMPLASQVVSGERADDKLYISVIQQVNERLNESGLLYVGDWKMAAKCIRAYVQNNEDYYLCPLSEVDMPMEELETYLQPVWSEKQALVSIERENAEGQLEKIAKGYEESISFSAEVGEKTIIWTERRLIVRSLRYAHAEEESLNSRLTKAQAELHELAVRKQGKKKIESVAEMQAACEKVLKQYRIEGLLKVDIREQSEERQFRAYGKHEAHIEVDRTVTLKSEINKHEVEEAKRRFGWRVYVTNQPQEELPLEKAILAYREEYLVERGFGCLKGKPLSVTPMYVQSDKRATGLIRLLSVGLRILTLIEHQ